MIISAQNQLDINNIFNFTLFVSANLLLWRIYYTSLSKDTSSFRGKPFYSRPKPYAHL